MKRVLVTGANGFVGRHLVDMLIGEGVEVIAAVRDPRRLPDFRAAVTPVRFELEHPELLNSSTLRDVDCIYHLAARVHIMKASQQEQSFIALNAHATEGLARLAAQHGVRRFVYLSSIKVNGERTRGRPFMHDDVPSPEDPYGRSKLCAEQALARVAAGADMELTVVRPPLVYGPGVGANFRRLLGLVSAGIPLPLGAVRNRRSMVAVSNLASLLCHVGRYPDAARRTFLVSDDDDLSTPRLLRLIASALNRKLTLLPIPVALLRLLGGTVGRSAEVARLVDSLQLDISLARTVLGWRPLVTVEEAIDRTVHWFEKVHRHAA